MIDSVGGRLLFGGGIVGSAACGLFIPMAANVSPYLVIFVRVLQGCCQGPLSPAFHDMANKWIPTRERNLLVTAVIAGLLRLGLKESMYYLSKTHFLRVKKQLSI